MNRRRPLDRVSLGVEALRRLTADDGRVATITRARVLERHHGRAGRRMLALAFGAAIPVVVSGALAATLIVRRTPALAPAPMIVAPLPPPRPSVTRRAPVEIAPATPTPALPPTPAVDVEFQAYGVAHAAHFARKDPAQALRLWNTYLQRYPQGRFVPEASYNRALTLVRLGRDAQAIAALKPIAAGRFGDYRRKEAEALVGALTARAHDR